MTAVSVEYFEGGAYGLFHIPPVTPDSILDEYESMREAGAMSPVRSLERKLRERRERLGRLAIEGELLDDGSAPTVDDDSHQSDHST